MTITDLIPALRGRGRRRAVDEVDRLREDNTKLLDRQYAADDYFAILTQDRDEVYRAWHFAEEKRQEAEEVAIRTLEENAALTAEVTELRTQLAPYLAAEANAHRVDVPPMVRDTTALEDQATGPIDVRPLWDALRTGPTVPVTDPGHVPQPAA